MIKRVNVKNLKKNEHYIYKNISNEYTLQLGKRKSFSQSRFGKSASL